MLSISGFFHKLPLRFGVTRIADFYLVLICFFFVSLAGGFFSTFTEIEVSSLHIFSRPMNSVDFTMGTIGGLLLYLSYPYLSNSFSLKTLLVSSLILGTLSTGLFTLFLKTDINFLLQFGRGVAVCLFYNTINCYISVLYNTPSRTTLFGMVMVLLSLSSALGSSLLRFLSGIWDVYLLSAVFMCVPIAAILLLSFPPLPAPSVTLKKATWLSTWTFFPILFILCLVLGLGFGGQSTYFPIYAEGLGLSEARASLFYAITILGSMVVVPVASWIADKTGYIKVFLGLTGLGIITTIWAIFTPSLIIMLILYFFITGILSSYTTLAIAWVAKIYVGGTSLPNAMSLQGIVIQIGGIFSPFAIGFFMTTFGNNGYNYWMFIGFIVCLIPLILAMYLTKNSQHTLPQGNSPDPS